MGIANVVALKQMSHCLQNEVKYFEINLILDILRNRYE
jgi:hypothetical protein